MGDQDKYNLAWKSFDLHVQSFLKDIFTSTHFTDVTLVSEDRQRIRAHRNVLSACSPVFKDLLLIDERNSQPIIFLKGIKYQELEVILQFIYLGQASFLEERASEFLEAAASLEIKYLNQLSQNNLTSSGQDENVSEVKIKYETLMEPQDFVDVQIKEITEEKDTPLSSDYLKCAHCELKYSTKTGLSCHIKAVHKINPIKPAIETFKCGQCDFQNQNKVNMTRHVKAKHEKIKHACNQCKNEYVYPNDLRRHILSAHEGKRYPCDSCSFTATQAGDLAKHIRNKHI